MHRKNSSVEHGAAGLTAFVLWVLIVFLFIVFIEKLPHPYIGSAYEDLPGEEISWGQRFFSFAGSEFFQRHNLQQEFNLHNVLTGQVTSRLKRTREIGLAAGLVGYGLIYPLLHGSGNRPALWLADHGLPVPPLCLSPYFVTGALCEVRLLSFNEAEIAELLVAMALAFLTLHHQHLLLKQEGQVHAFGVWPRQ